MNKLILQFLSEYIANLDPQYAVMLKGKWGCGKTHFVKEWLKTFELQETDENLITLEPIYVSAYGMTTIADIKLALDREINPFFYSSTGKFIKNTAKILGKIAFKTSLDLDGNNKEETSFSASLDSFALFKSDSESIRGTKLLVFDDIERCQINMKQLLGFINGFVEHCGCHVVVIGDEEHIDGDSKSAFDEFKEKTIGREFEIQPDIEGAIDYFLSEVPVCDYLRSQRDYIIQCFKSSCYNNLRVLRQCLYDFKNQLFQVEEPYENDNIFLHNILGSFIAVYFEYANKDNKPYITNWADFYQTAHLSNDTKKKDRLQQIQNKYKSVSQNCIYHVLCPEFVTHVVNHIVKGVQLVGYFTEHIQNRPKELMPWERLNSFYDLTRAEFDAAYTLSMEAVIAGGRINNYQLGTTVAYFSFFYVEGIRYFLQAHVSLIKRRLRELINSATTLQELYSLRASFVQGCNYVRYDSDEGDPLSDILTFFHSEFNKKSLILPDDMQQALRNLSDENVSSLVAIDKMPYPDRSSAYELRPIFEHEDPQQLFESIKSMSNRGRNEFSTFLSVHYMFNYRITSDLNRFSTDLPVLRQLNNLVETELANSTSVDRHVYSLMTKNFERAIKRAEGASEV